RDDHQQFGLVMLPLSAREQPAKDRYVLKEWDTGPDLLALVVEQAGDDQALIGPHVHRALNSPGLKGRNSEPGDLDRVREVDTRHFGLDGELDQTVAYHLAGELESYAELLELNPHLWDTGPSDRRHYRN